MRRSIALALLLCSCGPLYIGPPEYAPECVHWDPIQELRLSPELSPDEQAAYRKAAQSWASALHSEPLSVRVDGLDPNVVRMPGSSVTACWADGTEGEGYHCERAANIEWVKSDDGTRAAVISHASSDLDPYPVALHELGHAIAGNPCHALAGMMSEGAVSPRIGEAALRFVGTSLASRR